jgi:hypothetical protein
MKTIKLTALFLFFVLGNFSGYSQSGGISQCIRYQNELKELYLKRDKLIYSRLNYAAKRQELNIIKNNIIVLNAKIKTSCGDNGKIAKDLKKMEEKKLNTALNQREVNRIESKKNQGYKLSSEENKLLKNKENEIKNENKLKTEAVLKEKKFADKKANELKNQKSSAAIKEWKNEMNKFKKHTLEFTLNNKILLNQFDIFSPDPKIDFYRMVYLKPSSSWNLRIIESYLIKNNPKYIFKNKAEVAMEFNYNKKEAEVELLRLKKRRYKLESDLDTDKINLNKDKIKRDIKEVDIKINEINKMKNKIAENKERKPLLTMIKDNNYIVNQPIISQINYMKNNIVLYMGASYKSFEAEMNKLSSASASPGKVK